MDVLVVYFVNVVFPARCSDVGIFIEVAFQVSINRSEETVPPYVEFPFMDQQRVVYVFLNYKCSILSFRWTWSLLNNSFNVVNILGNFNTVASISIFSRFDYPHILLHLVLLLDFPHYFIRFVLNAITVIFFFRGIFFTLQLGFSLFKTGSMFFDKIDIF